MGKAQAMAFLEELEGKGTELGLDRVKDFLSLIGSPENSFKAVHIAGTNGKGSTSAMVESILREAGFKTGLYNSPHIVSFNERIKVNGLNISNRALVELVESTKKKMEESGISLTYFEFITAIAFKHFANQGVEIAVVEVGMGGRLDATNVVTPLVSVITNIAIEHKKHLGNTVAQIAKEKAGVIKENIPVVTAAQDDAALKVIRRVCREKASSL